MPRVQRIREELVRIEDALRKANNYEVDKFESKIETEMLKREIEVKKLPDDSREKILMNLDPDTSKWTPFEVVKSVVELERFGECGIQFMQVMLLEYASQKERLLYYDAQDSLQYRKMYQDPKNPSRRDRHVAQHFLDVQDDLVKKYTKIFADPKRYTRIVLHLDVYNKHNQLDLSLFVVFYRNILKGTVVVEVYHPELSNGNYDEHPVMKNITRDMINFLSKLDVKADVTVGIVNSELENTELIEYLPFLERYNTLPDYLFPMVWNMYLFLDRVREPLYTYTELERVTSKFLQIDADIREAIYLEFLWFILRFRFFLYITNFCKGHK